MLHCCCFNSECCTAAASIVNAAPPLFLFSSMNHAMSTHTRSTVRSLANYLHHTGGKPTHAAPQNVAAGSVQNRGILVTEEIQQTQQRVGSVLESPLKGTPVSPISSQQQHVAASEDSDCEALRAELLRVREECDELEEL